MGQVVNLVSNDVRRFDDSAVFWVFLWAGPLELMIVLALLIELLGPAAAFAGIASLLLVIPLQVQPWVPGSCLDPGSGISVGVML